MSPYDAPAPYSLLQYTELAEGIWYPKGGFHKVLESVERIAARHGARFHYGAAVREITVDGRTGAATGVRLADGTAVAGDAVVCNADLVYAYNRLLPETRYAARLARGAHTSSSVSFYWCMNAVVPQLRAHNVFLAGAYRESFDQIFAGRALPDEPSFYVNVPSRVDPTAAPAGRDTVVVLVPTGHAVGAAGAGSGAGAGAAADGGRDVDMDALVDRARDRVIDTVQRRLGIADLRAMIDHETVNDPRSWQAEFNLWNGSILGLSHSLSQVLWFRPSIKCKIFDNLYFVGASAQPGTGVPVVLCGAKMLEKQLCDAYLGGRGARTSAWRTHVFFVVVGVLTVLMLSVFSLF